MSGFKRLVKNSISNVINGFSNVILGVIISPLLINILAKNDFSIWSLVLQIGAFFSLLGFSGQLSVARYVTLATTENNNKKLLRVIQFGNKVAVYSFFLSVAVLGVIYFNFFYIFSEINMESAFYAPDVFFIVSFSFVIGLLFSVCNGYFTGIERNEVPALVNFFSRVVLGFGIYVSSHFGMMEMALTYFIVNFISFVVIYFLYLKFRAREKNKDSVENNDISFSEFFSYCLGVLVFNLSAFLIVNLNGILIGKYAFDNYAWYVLAITLVTAIVGFLNAALTPVLQPIVRLVHSNNKQKLNDFVYILTRIILLFSFMILVINLIIGRFALNIWVGKDISALTYPLFIFLLLTNLTRLLGAPLGLVYLAKGRQNDIIYLPLLEGIISTVMTFILVKKFGVYASAVSLAISTIIIMLIYSFKLINIAAIDSFKFKFRWLLAGGAILLLLTIYILSKVQLLFAQGYSIILFYAAMAVFSVVTFVKIFKDIKNIRVILES